MLGLPDKSIQLRDNFVELGGESLLALRACASLRYLLGKAEEDDGEDRSLCFRFVPARVCLSMCFLGDPGVLGRGDG